jgi:hypothetical protein
LDEHVLTGKRLTALKLDRLAAAIRRSESELSTLNPAELDRSRLRSFTKQLVEDADECIRSDSTRKYERINTLCRVVRYMCRCHNVLYDELMSMLPRRFQRHVRDAVLLPLMKNRKLHIHANALLAAFVVGGLRLDDEEFFAWLLSKEGRRNLVAATRGHYLMALAHYNAECREQLLDSQPWLNGAGEEEEFFEQGPFDCTLCKDEYRVRCPAVAKHWRSSVQKVHNATHAVTQRRGAATSWKSKNKPSTPDITSPVPLLVAPALAEQMNTSAKRPSLQSTTDAFTAKRGKGPASRHESADPKPRRGHRVAARKSTGPSIRHSSVVPEVQAAVRTQNVPAKAEAPPKPLLPEASSKMAVPAAEMHASKLMTSSYVNAGVAKAALPSPAPMDIASTTLPDLNAEDCMSEVETWLEQVFACPDYQVLEYCQPQADGSHRNILLFRPQPNDMMLTLLTIGNRLELTSSNGQLHCQLSVPNAALLTPSKYRKVLRKRRVIRGTDNFDIAPNGMAVTWTRGLEEKGSDVQQTEMDHLLRAPMCKGQGGQIGIAMVQQNDGVSVKVTTWGEGAVA